MSSAEGEVATVYAVFADVAEAERIGRTMIEGGHAACVNILEPCTSIYRWEGRIETAREVPALFKVARARAAELVGLLGALHGYATPAIVAWPVIIADPDYRRWVGGN